MYGGEALQGNGNLFGAYCPLFRSLKFYGWYVSEELVSNIQRVILIRQDPDADRHCATFLNEIRPGSLESFEIISSSQIGVESFLALNCHRESLTKLKLVGIKAEAVPAICMLKGCTNLSSVSLAEDGVATQDLEKQHNDNFLETIAWLRECKNLQSINMSKILSATGLLTPVLLEDGIKLTKLELEGYSMSDSENFHRALASQTNLQSLWLKGESSEIPSDSDVLVESISKLEQLTDLRFQEISNSFQDHHIRKIAQCLSKLETWSTSGWGITDAIWTAIGSLHKLQDLSLNALTRFSAGGIMDFILNLGLENKGLVLGITMQDMDCQLSEAEQNMIQETILAQVGGRFDFMYFRGELLQFEICNLTLMY